MISDDLKKIFDEDDSGLLDVPDKPIAQTSDERLVNSFLEIVAFYDDNGHPPRSATSNISERRLYSRLEGMRADSKKAEILKDFDKYDLLIPTEHLKTIDDIFDDDDLLGEDDSTGILTIRNVPDRANMSDYIGRQKPCKDFYQFEQKFVACQQELQSGQRNLGELRSESYIQKNRFYVVRGVLSYVADIGEIIETDKKQRNKGYLNARLRLIYENGTESDILLRSLARALYEDGRIVTETNEEITNDLFDITDEDERSGYVYVLQSLSENPEITKINNLYKIGFSSQKVEDRIKNASKDPTYLMAPVKIVATYRCYNMTPQKFEHLLHRFFIKARLDLEITDSLKEQYVPDEWFIVPLDVIDQVVTLLINGEIVNYHYDQTKQRIVLNDE